MIFGGVSEKAKEGMGGLWGDRDPNAEGGDMAHSFSTLCCTPHASGEASMPSEAACTCDTTGSMHCCSGDMSMRVMGGGEVRSLEGGREWSRGGEMGQGSSTGGGGVTDERSMLRRRGGDAAGTVRERDREEASKGSMLRRREGVSIMEQRRE